MKMSKHLQGTIACVCSPDLEGTCARIITALDTNKDRAISIAELNAAPWASQEYLLALDFSRADTEPRASGDGKLNIDECMEAVAEHFYKKATAEQKQELEIDPQGWRNWVKSQGCELHLAGIKQEL